MKQKKCGMGLIIVLIAVVFGACKGSVGVPVLGNKPKVLKPGEIPIKVTISDENFPSYRTIVPEDWNDAQKAALKFKLFNATGGSETQLGTDWTWAEIQTEGTASVVLTPGTYTLVMRAYSTASGSEKPVLESKLTNVAIGSTPYLDFVMKPYRADTTQATAAEAGEIEITVLIHNPEIYGASHSQPLITQAECSLTAIAGSTGTSIPAALVTPTSSGTGNDRKDSINFTNNAVMPGIYTFKAELKNGAGTTLSNISELVIVDPGKKSVKTIHCPVDLKAPPVEPANFKVEYKRPGDGDNDYEIVFTWDDRSVNEDGFTITVEGGSPSATKTFNVSANAMSYTITGSDKLVLVQEYTAKICAYNAYGTSAEVNYEDPKNGNKIHLARITYHLGGGTFLADPSNNLLGVVPTPPASVIAYYTFRNAGFEFKLPGTVGLPYVYKLDGSTPPRPYIFKGWNDGATQNLSKIAAGTKTALTFTAEWDIPLSPPSITFPSYNEEAYIDNANNYIVCQKTPPASTYTPVPITVHYATNATTITGISTTWYINGVAVTTPPASDTPGTKTSVLTFDPGDTHLSSLVPGPGVYHVMVVAKLDIPTSSTPPVTETKYVSAYCYVKVK